MVAFAGFTLQVCAASSPTAPWTLRAMRPARECTTGGRRAAMDCMYTLRQPARGGRVCAGCTVSIGSLTPPAHAHAGAGDGQGPAGGPGGPPVIAVLEQHRDQHRHVQDPQLGGRAGPQHPADLPLARAALSLPVALRRPAPAACTRSPALHLSSAPGAAVQQPGHDGLLPARHRAHVLVRELLRHDGLLAACAAVAAEKKARENACTISTGELLRLQLP